MSKSWEYRIGHREVAVDYSSQEQLEAKREATVQYLNMFGIQGWELIKIDINCVGSIEYCHTIWKREKF